jgi:hypothetical protein
MKNFITLLISWKYITDKNIDGKLVYLLPFLTIYIFLSTIFGDLLFLGVRLLHLRVNFVQKIFLPIGIFLLFTIPALLIYIYDKNSDINMLKEQSRGLDNTERQKIKIKAIVTVVVIAFLPLISLSIFSILIKLKII